MSDEAKSNSISSNGEPAATQSAVPLWIVVVTLMMVFLGGVYFDHHSGWFDADVYVPYTSAEELNAYQPKSGAAAVAAHGKQVFDTYCGICHGPDGMGKPNQAPPLAGSEWVNEKSPTRLIHIPLRGLNGPIKVKGQEMSFPSGMLALGKSMSDADLAAVLTYIRSAWGNKAGEVTPDEVKSVRASVGTKSTPLTSEELKNIPE
ncbi:MAG TPA: cytochrome c [Verrucomicrobiae bacterium]|nr:cytochrome c [Verrucomicrobiae bacterium]